MQFKSLYNTYSTDGKMPKGIRKESLNNLLSLYDIREDDDIKNGAFYFDAHNDALTVSRKYNVEYKRVVFAIAAISPQLYWEVNIKGVIELIENGSTHYGFPKNIDKAKRILFDGDFAALRGDKVTRFAYNILNPSKYTNEIVIDRHAMRAINGVKTGDTITPSPKEYAQLMAEYNFAAKLAGEKAGVFQAIIWSVIRKLSHQEVVSTRNNKRYQIKLEEVVS